MDKVNPATPIYPPNVCNDNATNTLKRIHEKQKHKVNKKKQTKNTTHLQWTGPNTEQRGAGRYYISHNKGGIGNMRISAQPTRRQHLPPTFSGSNEITGAAHQYTYFSYF